MVSGVTVTCNKNEAEKAEMRAEIVLWSELRFQLDKHNFYHSNYGEQDGDVAWRSETSDSMDSEVANKVNL